MAAGGDLDDLRMIDGGPRPAPFGGDARQRKERVRLRGGLGADAKLGAAGEDRQAQLLEDLLLDRGSPLLGGKDARLVLGEGGGDESLRAHRGRLALVI